MAGGDEQGRPRRSPAHLVLQLGDLTLEVADVLAGVAVVELALDLPFFFLSQAEDKSREINNLRPYISQSKLRAGSTAQRIRGAVVQRAQPHREPLADLQPGYD